MGRYIRPRAEIHCPEKRKSQVGAAQGTRKNGQGGQRQIQPRFDEVAKEILRARTSHVLIQRAICPGKLVLAGLVVSSSPREA